jgi:hypothetical protein
MKGALAIIMASSTQEQCLQVIRTIANGSKDQGSSSMPQHNNLPNVLQPGSRPH